MKTLPKHAETNRWGGSFLLLFFLLCGFGLLLQWNSLNLPLIRDEGEYAYAAWLLAHGDGMPYSASFLQKPPMIIYVYLLAMAMPTQAYWPPRLLALLFLVVSCWLLREIARHEFSPHAGATTPWLLLPMILLPGLNQFPANTEKFAVLPLVLLLYLFTVYRNKATLASTLAAGGIGAIIFLFKYSLAPIFLFVYGVWLFYVFKSNAKAAIRPMMKFAILLIAGFGCTLFVLLLPFILTHHLAALYECTIRFNQEYAIAHSLNGQAAMEWLKSFTYSWPLAVIFTILFFIRPIRHRLFFFGLMLAAFISSFGSSYGHYYIPFIVFWTLPLSAAVSEVAAWISKDAGVRHWLGLAGSMVLVLGMIWPNRQLFLMSPEKLEECLTFLQPFSESKFAAEKIKEKTTPNDRILVAGSEPQILYYARRNSATRFTIFYPLTLSTRLAGVYQKQAIEELEKNPPKVVAFIQCPYSWLIDEKTPSVLMSHLQRMLNGPAYRLMGYITKDHFTIQWHEAQPGSDWRSATILLFMRRDELNETQRE